MNTPKLASTRYWRIRPTALPRLPVKITGPLSTTFIYPCTTRGLTLLSKFDLFWCSVKSDWVWTDSNVEFMGRIVLAHQVQTIFFYKCNPAWTECCAIGVHVKLYGHEKQYKMSKNDHSFEIYWVECLVLLFIFREMLNFTVVQGSFNNISSGYFRQRGIFENIVWKYYTVLSLETKFIASKHQ